MSTTGAEPPSLGPEQQPPSKTKRSFLQRLNKRHGTLSLHMRSKRGEKLARQQSERKTHSRNTSASQNEFSEPAPSLISSSTSDRKLSEAGSRYYDIDDELSPTTPQFSPGIEQENGFEVPIRYVVARNDKEGGQDFITGMQSFLHRKQTSNASKLESPTYPPPPPPGEGTSIGVSREMSDEEMENWLKPEDADLHRERKSSEDLSAHSQMEEKSGEEEQAVIEKARVSVNSVSNSVPYPEDWNTDPEVDAKQEENTAEEQLQEIASQRSSVAREVAATPDDSRELLALPDELLQEIALYLDTNSAWLFRLSCRRLYDKMPIPPSPTGTEEEVEEFFSRIRSFVPSHLTFCTECRKYHPWTTDDYYYIDWQGNAAPYCRRHLNSGRQPQDEILGAGNFLCDSCNTVRGGKKCKTCAKCEACARLRKSWMLMSWVEDECDYCAASHSPKWKHWKGEFEGRVNPGEHREWMGV